MEIGTCVVTLTDKLATDGLDKVFMPKGPVGTVFFRLEEDTGFVPRELV